MNLESFIYVYIYPMNCSIHLWTFNGCDSHKAWLFGSCMNMIRLCENDPGLVKAAAIVWGKYPDSPIVVTDWQKQTHLKNTCSNKVNIVDKHTLMTYLVWCLSANGNIINHHSSVIHGHTFLWTDVALSSFNVLFEDKSHHASTWLCDHCTIDCVDLYSMICTMTYGT